MSRRSTSGETAAPYRLALARPANAAEVKVLLGILNEQQIKHVMALRFFSLAITLAKATRE